MISERTSAAIAIDVKTTDVEDDDVVDRHASSTPTMTEEQLATDDAAMDDIVVVYSAQSTSLSSPSSSLAASPHTIIFDDIIRSSSEFARHLPITLIHRLYNQLTEKRLKISIMKFETHRSFYEITQEPYNIPFGCDLYWRLLGYVLMKEHNDANMRREAKRSHLFIQFLCDRHKDESEITEIMQGLSFSAITQLREEFLTSAEHLEELCVKAKEYAIVEKRQLTGKTVYMDMGWRSIQKSLTATATATATATSTLTLTLTSTAISTAAAAAAGTSTITTTTAPISHEAQDEQTESDKEAMEHEENLAAAKAHQQNVDGLLGKATDLHRNNEKLRLTGKTVYDVIGCRQQTHQHETIQASSSPSSSPSLLVTSSPSPMLVPEESDSTASMDAVVAECSTRSHRLLLAKAAQQRAMNQINNAAAQCISSHQQEYDEAMIDRSEDVAMTSATLGELMNDKASRNKPHRVTPIRATRAHQKPIIISSSSSTSNSRSRKRRRGRNEIVTPKPSKRSHYTNDLNSVDESITTEKSSVIINLIEELNETLENHVIVIDDDKEQDDDDDDDDDDEAKIESAVHRLVNDLTKDDLRHVIADMLKIMWRYRDEHNVSD